ncbi:hypothetical protein BKA70DRAFT_398590 [Coprinopsis sp. MPI-PUGE-AT-0042]|nr:hypothetical protein BKA70DRAFT_398590 [Coprinopsis sp. MPI-PUGE-AT-0042]
MTHDHAQVTRRSRQAPPGNHISRTFDSPPTPATEGFKARNRSAITTHRFFRGRNTRKPRQDLPGKTTIQVTNQTSVRPPVELSMSTSTTSTITAAPKATHQTQGSILQSSKSRQFIKEERERPVNAPYRTAPSHPTNKKSVSSFVSSSAEKALPLPPPVLEAPIPSNVQAEEKQGCRAQRHACSAAARDRQRDWWARGTRYGR